MPVDALTHLPDGSEVLIDANIFVYALLEVSPQCVELLRRCSDEQVRGNAFAAGVGAGPGGPQPGRQSQDRVTVGRLLPLGLRRAAFSL